MSPIPAFTIGPHPNQPNLYLITSHLPGLPFLTGITRTPKEVEFTGFGGALVLKVYERYNNRSDEIPSTMLGGRHQEPHTANLAGLAVTDLAGFKALIVETANKFLPAGASPITAEDIRISGLLASGTS